MNNFGRVYRFVLSIQTDTKATAACHAAELGYTDSQIRALGRWKSDGFKLYIRNETLAANWIFIFPFLQLFLTSMIIVPVFR